MTKGVQDRMAAVARVCADFHRSIYQDRDVDAAVSFVTEDCVLENFPQGRGAAGVADLRRYLAEDVLPHLPADLAFRRVSRTGDRWRVAHEDIVTFTHDRELPWLLPGVAATGRRAEVLAISVVTVQVSSVNLGDSAVVAHRTLWDHTALIAQLDVSREAGAALVDRAVDPAVLSRARPHLQL